MTKILITGLHSYTGHSLTQHLSNFPDKYQTSTISLRNDSWLSESFRGFDAVFHVAGIAHDSTKHSDKDTYYRVNSQLAFDAAHKAKTDGVRQFIFMSSSIVYGSQEFITRDTPLNPASFYGDSKVKAEEMLQTLHDDEGFRVCVLRCPMVYGKGSRGNYPLLSKIARTLPIFPKVNNRRSMLYSENLAEFVRLMIENREWGIFWPQNSEYSNTSELVRMIAAAHGKRVVLVKGCEGLLKAAAKFSGKISKAFGSLAYDMTLSEYKENYRLYSLSESIMRTER